jgi:hypothetical protein
MPGDELRRGQKPGTPTKEILIMRLEVLRFETEVGRIDLMMAGGISRRTDKIYITDERAFVFSCDAV